ncbi:MAG: hypothetical protein COW42_10470 [Deltaproteobacteria bacterium CG17_big_fil_post_rev_8_21_14_2_50_63_7]|nr:MAG: hypothetical protein COW42_10470 [Deltaproteobacteria bacterium CG17_big_fil_post_rev_8_21_14_2_50_63_7]
MSALSALLIGFLLLVALLLLFSQRDTEGSATNIPRIRGALQPRIARHIDALASTDPAVCKAAQNALLSMGAGIIPYLLAHLERVDSAPFELTAAQQLKIEALLADFGPQTMVQTRRFLRRVHRVSPVFPALLRVLQGIAPDFVDEVSSRGDEFPFSLLAPFVKHVHRQSSEEEFLEIIARSEGDSFLVACLPFLSEELVDRLATISAARAADIRALWFRVALQPIALPTDPRPRLDENALRELLEAETNTAAEVVQLAANLADPRVHERFFRLIAARESSTEVASTALRELARAGVRDLQPQLNRLLRAPQLGQADIDRLRVMALFCPEPAAQALTISLRSETPRVVVRAAEILCVLPLENYVHAYLKALGRHRYSPLEPILAAPILARWEVLSDKVVEAVEHDDREIQLTAVELVAVYPGPSVVPRLLKVLGNQDYFTEVILNALEVMGPSILVEGRKALRHGVASVDGDLMQRRLELLEALEQLAATNGGESGGTRAGQVQHPQATKSDTHATRK